MLVNRTLGTQDASDPQNSYRSVRTFIADNLDYDCGHGQECPDDRSRHFGTGYEVFRVCFGRQSYRSVFGLKCPVIERFSTLPTL